MVDDDKPKATLPSEGVGQPPNRQFATDVTAYLRSMGLLRPETDAQKDALRSLQDSAAEGATARGRGRGETVRLTIVRSIAEVEQEAKDAESLAHGSDHSPPETPTQAARVLIGWFAGALAFEAVHSYAEGKVPSAIGYGIGAIAVAIGDYKLKSLLSGFPELTRSLNRIASDARWWVGAAMITLLLIALSPFIEQRRLPFVWQNEVKPSGVVESQEPKTIVQVTPEYLLSLYAGVMSSQGDRLLAPYIGKWIRVTQTVSDTKGNSVWTYISRKPDGTKPAVVLLFDFPKWADNVAILAKGQSIKALCQIAPAAKSDMIVLEHCELENKD